MIGFLNVCDWEWEEDVCVYGKIKYLNIFIINFKTYFMYRIGYTPYYNRMKWMIKHKSVKIKMIDGREAIFCQE